MANAPSHQQPGTDETPDDSHAERLDREHEQFFHELRSILPGAEVQFAFLLTVAFTERFRELSDLQRAVYYATFICAGVSIVLLLAPAAFHRVRFRQHDKEAMIRLANVEAIAALVLVSLSVAGTVLLISDLLLPTWSAALVSGSLWLFATVLWWAFPLVRRRADDGEPLRGSAAVGLIPAHEEPA